MIAESATIVIPSVLFLATLIHSAFGFGEALVAVPLLALVVPVEVAAPVAVLVSITVAFIVVVQDWREVQVRSAGALVLPTMLGIPLGLILRGDLREVELALAVALTKLILARGKPYFLVALLAFAVVFSAFAVECFLL